LSGITSDCVRYKAILFELKWISVYLERRQLFKNNDLKLYRIKTKLYRIQVKRNSQFNFSKLKLVISIDILVLLRHIIWNKIKDKSQSKLQSP